MDGSELQIGRDEEENDSDLIWVAIQACLGSEENHDNLRHDGDPAEIRPSNLHNINQKGYRLKELLSSWRVSILS
jgi:hypothetical protein